MKHIVSHAQSHKGLVRKINEDACLALGDAGVWVVADGMGGHAAGDVASKMVIDTINDMVSRHGLPSVRSISEALQQANSSLWQYSRSELHGHTAGSTVVVLLIDKFHYHLLWAGDSRGYILRDTQLRQLTRDHSQVNELVEQGLLASCDAEQHELANVITRAVGVDESLIIDVVSGVWQPGDLFLLCSDGLTKELPDAEICEYLDHTNIAEANQALLHSTLVAGARDNVTTVLIKLASKQFVNGADVTIPKYVNLNKY